MNDQVQLSFSLDGCKKDSTYKIEFELDKDKFETEKQKNVSNNSHIEFSNKFICNYDFRKIQFFILKLTRWKDRTHFIVQILGETYKLSLSNLVTADNSTFTCLANNKNKNSEKITIKVENPNYSEQKQQNKFTFFDYMKAGIKLKSIIGIDFTQGSEHGIDEKNIQYLQAISEFREIMFCYMRDFYVYGYGAQFSDINQKHEFFNMNLKDKSPLHGYTNIERAYKECLKKINYCYNASLSPLVRNIKHIILDNYKEEDYYIFLLLISNPPKREDIQNCIDVFIENTYLPLSVVVIGIGDKDFKDIKNICSRKHKYSSKDQEKLRNNIYFFPLKDFNFKYDLVLNECLKEIPKQLVEYYSINKTSPDDIKAKNVSNLKNSIKLLDSKRSCFNIDEGSAPPSYLEFSIKDSQSNESKNYNLNQSNNNENNAYDKFGNLINNNNNIKDSKNNKFPTDQGNSEDNKYYNIDRNRIAQNNEDQEQKNNYIPNPYSSNSNNINKINEFKEDEKYKEEKLINETPMGFKVEKEKIEDDKIDNYNSSINKINFNYDKDQYYSKISRQEDNKYYNKKYNNDDDDDVKYYNETPKQEDSKNNNKINNDDDDDVKYYNETPKQGDNINNSNQIINNDEDEKDKYYNKIPEKDKLKINFKNNINISNNEEKYYNETPKPGAQKSQFDQFQFKFSNSNKNVNPFKKKELNNINNQFQNGFSNNKINNIISDDEKVYYNQTPGGKEDKKYPNRSNPFSNNINLNKQNNEDEKEEKLVNATPGGKETLNMIQKNNPYKMNNIINDSNVQNQEYEIRKSQTEKIVFNKSSLGNQFKQSLELIKKRSSINASKESTKSSHNSYGLNEDDKIKLADSNLPNINDYGRDY